MKPLDIQRLHIPLEEILRNPEYVALIDRRLLRTLASPSTATRWVAVEAKLDGELAALALAEVYPLNRIANLNSLVIKENCKGQGIWRALFSYMQEMLSHEEKMKGMEWRSEQNTPEAPAIEEILHSLGWPTPALYLMRLHFDAYAFNPPWIRRSFTLPANMHFFSWKDLSPEDRNRIAYLAEQGRFLPHLSPLYKEESIDLETSIGLRQDNLLVGWSITRREDPDTLCYASLYVDSDLLYSGYGIQLLVESIRRHKKLPIPNAVLEIKLKEIDPSWWHFVNKRLLPLAKKVERIKNTFRVFHENLS